MGIKYLNRLFNLKCNSKAIYKIHLQTLVGKKIAVDASIFLYRFLGEDKLIEQMYLMVSILRNYNILPIFVFDGMSPPEKKGLLIERKENKRLAEEKYEIIKKQYYKLALKYHPDKNKSIESNNKFQDISNAYNTLISVFKNDEKQKKLWDKNMISIFGFSEE